MSKNRMISSTLWNATITSCASRPKKLKFLDVVNYIAPGFAFSKYILAYKISVEKGLFFFYYKCIDYLDKLDGCKLPEHKDIVFQILRTIVSPRRNTLNIEQFGIKKACRPVENSLHGTTIKKLCHFWLPCEKHVDFYADLLADMFKDTISLPVTFRYLFKTLPRGYFHVVLGVNKELQTTMRNNITGGSSIIFHRYHEQNKTCKRENEDKVV